MLQLISWGETMIKVLLVDDEKMALNYLKNLISWEYYDFQLIGVTTDTQQSLMLFKKYRPDIVITDVKMPGMNGLEMVGAIREIDSKVHILFLSAYKNFDYAKTAIHLGSDDYLLKSDLDEENFLKKMLNLKEEIDKEKNKNRYTINAILEELFQKNTKEEHYKNLLEENEYIKIHKKYNYVVLAKKDVPAFVDEIIPQSDRMEEIFDFEIRNICDGCAEKNHIRVIAFFPVSKHDLLAIMELEGNPVAQKEINDQLYSFSKQIYETIHKKNDTDYFIYYYTNRMSVRTFGRYYFKHRSALMNRYVKKKPHILEFMEDKMDAGQEKQLESVSADEIYMKIKANDKQAMDNIIENIKISVEMEDCMTYLWYAQNLLRALKKYDGVLSGEKSKRRFSLNESNTSYDLRNPDEMIKFIELKLEEVMVLSHEQKNETYSDAVIKAMNFIRKKYTEEDLSTGSVAREVNLSSSWFSTKFKEEVGIGVADYINSVRIEEAKKLFDAGDLMIYEISEKVGFTSSQYFSKIFKEYTGITPNQYRKRKKEQ